MLLFIGWLVLNMDMKFCDVLNEVSFGLVYGLILLMLYYKGVVLFVVLLFKD